MSGLELVALAAPTIAPAQDLDKSIVTVGRISIR
jgi:hypothetical protein